MYEIPLVGPAYQNRELALSAQVSKNLWPEINPEARSVAALHNTPGCKPFALMSGADRGMHDFNGTLFTVKGTTLYSVDADGVDTTIGTIAGSERCIFANDSIQLIITTGATAYKYTVAGGLEAITDPDLVNPVSVAYMNSQFVLDQNRGVSGEFVSSSIDPTFSVDALDFATAEGHPDDIVRVFPFNQNMYFYGSDSVEPWYNSGTGNPPWARVQGGVRPIGLAGTHAITATSEYMYFLDNKRRPMRSGGLDFVNIGTPAVGVEFARYSRISDCIVMQYTQDNQQFVVFTFPTANRTWGFHEPSGSWFQMSYGVNDARSRVSSLMYIYGLTLAADHSNGAIYHFDPCTYTDNGEVIQRVRQTAVIHGGLYGKPNARMFFSDVEFIIAAGACEVLGTGPGPDPVGTAVAGVCGTTADLEQGELLSVHGLQLITQTSTTVGTTTPNTDGFALANSKAISCTAAFCRGLEPTSSLREAYLIQILDTDVNLVTFGLYMETDGFIYAIGRNPAGTVILNVKITNSGASFADSDVHTIGMVVNMDDSSRREIWLDGVNVTDNTDYVTWTTYTDGLIQLDYNTLSDDMDYYFGGGFDPPSGTFHSWGSISPTTNLDSAGYICFDNDCSLIGAGIFDENGYLRDPQGDFTGWFTHQPKIAFSQSFIRQMGSLTGFDILNIDYDATYYYIYAPLQLAGSQVNNGVAGSTDADTGSGSLPPPPPATSVSLPSPHWINLSGSMSYNYVNPASYTNASFAAVFGLPIEDRNYFEITVSTNVAVRINTTDPDQRMTFVGTTSFRRAAMVLVNASGTIVDWVYMNDTPANYGKYGGNLTIPADGQDYFLIMTSDTGRALVRMWDSA